MPASAKPKPKHECVLRDVFVTTNWKTVPFNESEGGLPDGVVARIVGPMAMRGGVSLNKRYYSPKLWDNCMEDVKPRLADGGMWGTVGHDVPMDETALKTGEITHRIMKLWPGQDDDGNDVVMGEIHLLENDIGKNINLYMRQGMKIAVSTRAYGEISGKGKGPGGSDIIDENNFHLVGIDFVVNPGVPMATPIIVESFEEEFKEEKSGMDLEKLVQMNEKLGNEKTELAVEVKAIATENKQLNEKLDEKTRLLEKIQEKLGDNPLQSLSLLFEGLRKWSELEPFTSLARETDLHKQSGGSVEKFVTKAVELVEKYSKNGSPEQISEKLAVLDKYLPYGPPADVEAGYQLLEEYKKTELSPKEVTITKKKAEKMLSIFENTKRIQSARKIAKKFIPIEENESEELTKQRKNLEEAIFEMFKTGLDVATVIKTIQVTNGLKLEESAPKKPTVPAKTGLSIPTQKRQIGGPSSVSNIFESFKPVDPTAEAERKAALLRQRR